MNKRHLPPLNALRTFETAARTGSFSEAAAELGVTHGAVSRQIRLLEEWLGQPLFTRAGQRNIATAHARAFAAEVSAAFDLIGDASVRFGRTPSTRVVKVNAQTTIATRWLIPRLARFNAAHPQIEVAITTANSNDAWKSTGFDLLIRKEPLERPEWQHFIRQHLFTEQLTVFAAPTLLETTPLVKISDLVNHIFIASQTRVGEWDRWLHEASADTLRPERFQRFDHYHVCLQAMIDGLGVGIGGYPMLDNEVKSGRLIAPFALSVPGSSYAMWLPRDAAKSSALKTLLSWLEQEAKPCDVSQP